MDRDWTSLLPFELTLKEGSPDTGPPTLAVESSGTLEDGRTIYAYLVPKYKADYRTMDGYMECYREAERVRDLLNETIEQIGMRAYRPG